MLKANSDHKEIESCASLIAKALNTDRDPLQRAEQQLGITEAPTPVPAAGTAVTAMEQEFVEDDETSPVEARLQRVKSSGARWRFGVRLVRSFGGMSGAPTIFGVCSPARGSATGSRRS